MKTMKTMRKIGDRIEKIIKKNESLKICKNSLKINNEIENNNYKLKNLESLYQLFIDTDKDEDTEDMNEFTGIIYGDYDNTEKHFIEEKEFKKLNKFFERIKHKEKKMATLSIKNVLKEITDTKVNPSSNGKREGWRYRIFLNNNPHPYYASKLFDTKTGAKNKLSEFLRTGNLHC